MQKKTILFEQSYAAPTLDLYTIPVENGFAQRLAVFVYGQAVSAQRAGTDGFDVLGVDAGFFNQRLADDAEIAPPILLGIVLIMSGLGVGHLVLRGMDSQYFAGGIHHNTLTGIRSGINSYKICFFHMDLLTI